MKNQYFGDINDYRKYGLLRALQAGGNCKVLVAWMLTPDDGGGDGGMRTYLRQPDPWKKHDPTLFDGLVRGLADADTPNVSIFEVAGLLPRTECYSALVPDTRDERGHWWRDLMARGTGADLVFVDPDNGIEVASRPPGRKGSSKYVLWEEIRQLWEAGRSVLIYQHFCREQRDAFAARMISELRARTGARSVHAFRTPHVLFLLLAQQRHEEGFNRGIADLKKRWGREIRISPPPPPPA